MQGKGGVNMGLPSLLLTENGVLTTIFYEDADGKNDVFGNGIAESEEITGLYCCVRGEYHGSGIIKYSGKIYIDGGNIFADKIAADGEIIGGRKVRVQRIKTSGGEFTVKSVKRVMLGGALHHIEAEVC